MSEPTTSASGPPVSGSSAGRRLSTITVDQAIAGASNVLVAVLAARALGVASFGLFGIVFLVYVTAQGVSRALVCEPLLVHPDEARERPGDAIGTAGVLGLALAVVVAAAGGVAHVWDHGLGNGLLVLGACLPLLVMQDLGRFLAFAVHRPGRALALDVLWLVLVCLGVGLLFVLDAETLTWFIVAWAGSGAVAGVLLFWQVRGHRLRLSLSWLRETWSFSWRYLLSFTATQGAALAGSIGLGAIAGARALGAVRGALLLVRPFMLMQSASIAAGVAEVANEPGDRTAVRRHVRRTTLLTTVVAVGNMVVLLVLPDVLGEQVLGATWAETEELLVPAGLQMVFLGLLSGVRSALLGLRAIRTTVVIDVVTTALVLAATLAGAVVDGALGAWWAVAGAQAVVAVIWWTTWWRHPKVPVHPDGDASTLPTSHDPSVRRD